MTAEFSIKVKDLTSKGLEFFRTGVQVWLRSVDRDNTKPLSSKILERELAKQRSEK